MNPAAAIGDFEQGSVLFPAAPPDPDEIPSGQSMTAVVCIGTLGVLVGGFRRFLVTIISGSSGRFHRECSRELVHGGDLYAIPTKVEIDGPGLRRY